MNPPDWQWIFGLSIDSELSWGAVQVDAANGFAYQPQEKLELTGGHMSDLPASIGADGIHDHIVRKLVALRDSGDVSFLHEIQAVGVSTIGIANHQRAELVSVARNGWSAIDSDRPIVDFGRLFSIMLRREVPIRIQNDATAKALFYFYWANRDRPPAEVKALFYAMFGEGVNGSLVQPVASEEVFGGAPIADLLHQELGHIFPPRHPADFSFDPAHSGCPIHTHCYEGLASGIRIRNQWGNAPFERPDHPAWDIISWYMVNFIWTVSVTIPPERVLISSLNRHEGFLEKIRKGFRAINQNNVTKEPFIFYNEIRYGDFISLVPMPDIKKPYLHGIYGALELARLQLSQSPPSALGKSLPIPFKKRDVASDSTVDSDQGNAE